MDTLFQNFDKLSVSVVTPAPILPPCEVCGIVGHTSVEWQLGSDVESPKQANYAQYNQGFKNNQNSYRNPQNPFGQQTTWPDFANNQRGPQKSNLEFLLENFVLSQTKQNQEFKNQTEFLNDSLIKLTSKTDSIVTHNKMLETQISQVAQQVASSSQTSGIFPGQPETNHKRTTTEKQLGECWPPIVDPPTSTRRNSGAEEGTPLRTTTPAIYILNGEDLVRWGGGDMKSFL